jgi:hypothetical protein
MTSGDEKQESHFIHSSEKMKIKTNLISMKEELKKVRVEYLSEVNNIIFISNALAARIKILAKSSPSMQTGGIGRQSGEQDTECKDAKPY